MPSDSARPQLAPRPEDPRRLHILMVAACPFPAARGTPIRITRMAEALAARGHDVHVATYHLSAGSSPRGVVVHRTPAVPTYRRVAPGPSYQKLLIMDPLLARTARGIARSHRFDVVHAHHAEGLAVAMTIRPKRAPLVFDAHTLLGAELPEYGLGIPKRLLERVGRHLDAFLPRRADHVIAVTDAIGSHFRRHGRLPASDVTVVENGVEWEMFTQAPGRGSAGEPPVIVFAGNMAPYQGIDRLLEAFALVRRSHPHVRLVVATEDTPGFQRYRPLAERLNLLDAVVVRPTPLDELPGVLAAASIAVSPRPAGGGMPMKILNYMAAALPTVSFQGSAGPLEHDRTGWVVRDGDVEAFAAGIAKILRQPDYGNALGARARTVVRSERSWDAVAARVENVYRLLLSPPGSP